MAILVSASAFAQQPRIDSIVPSRGPIAGGTIVVLSGANFTGATVKFDRAAIAPLSQTETEVRLQMPAHDNGYALIQIGSSAAEFLYVPPRLEDLPAGSITTVAGVGRYLRLELPATEAMVTPSDLTLGPNGDIYFMQGDRGLLFRIDSQGILHHVAGTLGTFDWQFVGDGGSATNAVFAFARSVAVDATGNAYITDIRGRIRKVDGTTGIVTTVAGTGEVGFSGDGGPATEARIGQPTHIVCGTDGTLYFLDALPVGGGTPRNLRVRRVSTDGIITTVAGNGAVGDLGDGGPAIDAPLNIGLDDFGDVAVDSGRNVFILEVDGQRIRKVDATTGVITTFASLAFPPGDGRTINVSAIATDAAGNVYAGTSWNFLKFDPSGRLLRSWGAGHGFSEDGTPATSMDVGGSLGMAIASNGDIIYSDITVARVRKIDAATETIVTLAGISPAVIGVPGDPLGAVFIAPAGDLAFAPSGDLIFSDAASLWIYRIDFRAGAIVPFAGTGGFRGSYEGSTALETGVYAVAVDAAAGGTVYFADKNTIRSIESDGRVRVVAGSPGEYGFSGDGAPARDALLCQPHDVAFDRQGNVFIADTNNNRIRRIDASTGVITTVAGSGASNGFEGYGRGSFCGDGGPALSACFNSPVGVAVRDDGSIYISDFGNEADHKMRKVAPSGIVSTLQWPLTMKVIVGPGQSIFGHGLTKIYRADHDEVRILTGGDAAGFSGDGGPAGAALMAFGEAEQAQGIAIDPDGNLFFHDAGNRRIRAIRYGAVLAPPNATIQAAVTGSTIRATVSDDSGRTAPGVRVDFTAPSFGASCTLSSPFAITDRSGVASVSCTSNCIPGTYAVTATPLTATSTASVAFANGGPCRRRAVRHGL